MSEKCNSCETKIKLLKGDRGPKGEKGDRGERGAVGPVGPVGATGPQGNQGPAGNQGVPGEKGLDGSNGNKGDQGVQGEQGPPGNDGQDAVQPVVEFENTCGTEVTEITGFPNYKFKVDIVDTGWLPLEGFDHYTGVTKPKVKRVGKQLFFKGQVIIPLAGSAGGAVIPLATSNSYVTEAFNHTFRGLGGCKINTNGGVTFNYAGVTPNPDTDSSGCDSVLPAGLNLCSLTIDDVYAKQVTASRQIDTDNSENGTSLSAAFNVSINTTGNLTIQTLRDIENNSVSGGSNAGGSPLRYITSKVVAGDLVPDFSNASSRLHTFKEKFANILNPGTGYTDGTYTNVNFLSSSGATLVGTVVILAGMIVSVEIKNINPTYITSDTIYFSGINVAGILAGADFRCSLTGNITTSLRPNTAYPFSCDASEPEQIGGFVFSLDGLIAHLS